MDVPLLEVKTSPIDYKTYREFALFSMRRNREYRTGAVFVAACFFTFVDYDTLRRDKTIGLAFCLVGCCLLAWYLWRHVKTPKFWYKKLERFSNCAADYRFFEDSMECSAVGEHFKKETSLHYEIIEKIFEVERALYLQAADGIRIIPKCDLTAEQMQALREWFTAKFGGKFISYCEEKRSAKKGRDGN